MKMLEPEFLWLWIPMYLIFLVIWILSIDKVKYESGSILQFLLISICIIGCLFSTIFTAIILEKELGEFGIIIICLMASLFFTPCMGKYQDFFTIETFKIFIKVVLLFVCLNVFLLSASNAFGKNNDNSAFMFYVFILLTIGSAGGFLALIYDLIENK